jgi:hypothetical protein
MSQALIFIDIYCLIFHKQWHFNLRSMLKFPV